MEEKTPEKGRRHRPGRPCPACGEPRLHRSRSRSLSERFLRGAAMARPWRCHACGWRGLRPVPSRKQMSWARRVLRRNRERLIAGVALVGVLVWVLWYLSKPVVPAPEPTPAPALGLRPPVSPRPPAGPPPAGAEAA